MDLHVFLKMFNVAKHFFKCLFKTIKKENSEYKKYQIKLYLFLKVQKEFEIPYILLFIKRFETFILTSFSIKILLKSSNNSMKYLGLKICYF